jgi:peptidyl-prolyl cis-trans isomerase C
MQLLYRFFLQYNYPMRIKNLFIYTCILLAFSGCKATPPTPAATETPAAVTPSATVVMATATPNVPMAAIVNGQGIPQSLYEGDLKSYKASSAAGVTPADGKTPEQTVIQDLVDQVLLSQGAAEKGFTVEDSALQDRINQLAEKMGGQQALDAWVQAQGYSQDDFKQEMRLSIAAAWMRDQITSAVPTTAEQVHVRQILFTEQANAQSVLQEVRSGSDFATLAGKYDTVTRGDIGWFPRGYLTQPQVEEAAFKLQAGEVSDVITSDIGYHLIQVIERDPNHPLSPDALAMMQHQAVQTWLTDKQKTSQIEMKVQ